jgi:CubicO group peptidase (beta-lactamase class C family)
MNKRAKLAVGCVLLALAGCSDAGESPGKSREPALPGPVRELIDQAVQNGFSGAILVTREGEALTSEAHGLADRDRATPNTPNTAFDMGSIVKSFTATAIFRLSEDGVVALDTTLAEIFPNVPDDKADITLREIVQHRAGFGEYHDTMGDFEPMSRLEARARIFAQELLFSPDTDEAYSNSGYTLLADVIETVSGEPYVDFVHRALLEPAGMSSSGFYSEAVWSETDTAIGYDASKFADNDPASWPYTWALVGNGGLVTTVGDLDRFFTAVFSGRVVRQETLERLREVYFGTGQMAEGGEVLYGEAGAGDFGLGGVAVLAPESNTSVIVATNTYEVFDIESFATAVSLQLLESD